MSQPRTGAVDQAVSIIARRRRGFTLAEMVTVVSMAAMLLALAVPAVHRVRESARSATCVSNLRQMGAAVHSYALDRGYLPPSHVQTNPKLHWTGLLTEHLTTERMEYDQAGNPLGENLPIFMCPSATLPNTGPLTRYSHYSAHKVLMPTKWALSGWTGSMYKLSQIHRPSEVILIADGVQSDQTNENGNAGNAFPTFSRIIPEPVVWYNAGDPDNNDPIDESTNTNQDIDANHGHIRYRHRNDDFTNVAFVDGHVATVRRGGILNLNIRTNQ